MIYGVHVYIVYVIRRRVHNAMMIFDLYARPFTVRCSLCPKLYKLVLYNVYILYIINAQKNVYSPSMEENWRVWVERYSTFALPATTATTIYTWARTPARTRDSHSSLPLTDRHRSSRTPPTDPGYNSSDFWFVTHSPQSRSSDVYCCYRSRIVITYCYYCTCVRRRCTWRHCPHGFSIGNILYVYLPRYI
jgi:hypothetical protein